jgi:hypothetical protein
MYKLKFENSKLASELSIVSTQRNVLAALTATLAAAVLALLLKRERVSLGESEVSTRR